MSTRRKQHSLVVRALWYLFVGWWATGLWLSAAWLLSVTVIGLPVGIKMINAVPKVLTLKERSGSLIDGAGAREQPNLLFRGAYFLLVGWWASLAWMGLAYLISLTVVGLPIAVWLYNRLPYVTTLYRY
jgi:uncharacterized membrane protein YccF (DUF307 family)